MTTMTVNALREQMLRHLDDGNGCGFLTMASPYLAACSDDHYVRLMAVREYLKLGLVRPGKELLEGSDELLGGVGLPPELDALRSSLVGVQGGPVPWDQYTDRFEGNLNALSERGVDVSAIRSAWIAAADSYELYEIPKFGVQVRRREGSDSWRWVPSLMNHRAVAEAVSLPDDTGSMQPGPYMFEGLDLGCYFERIYEATLDTFLGYSCALYVVEPEPAAFAMVLHLHDWQKLLADDRVYALCGDDAAEQLCTLLRANPDLPWPRNGFSGAAVRQNGDGGAIAAMQRAMELQEQTIRNSFTDIEARYASRDLSYWVGRFEEALSEKGKPLRILSAVSHHTTFLRHSIRDAKRAFEQLGHECVVLAERNDHTVISPMVFHDAIRELDPDVFLSLDHLRSELAGTIPANLPILTWDQDQLPHVFTPKNMKAVARHDFIVGCSKSLWLHTGCNPRQARASRVPTSPDEFDGDPLTTYELARYGCDISFVSHASQTPLAFHEAERASYKEPKLARLLDEIYELLPEKLARHGPLCGNLTGAVIEEASNRCGIAIKDETLRGRLRSWYVWRLADRLYRHEALTWAADWAKHNGRSLRIYGNGWDQHPTLAAYAAGPARNGRELLGIYRASKINLQLMPAGFIHQRALDGLCAGGFFLTRATPKDLLGKTLRQLDERMTALGIDSSRALHDTTDKTVRSLHRTYVGEWMDRFDPNNNDAYNDLRVAAELLFPDEAFSHYEQIRFDSAEQFGAAAEKYLADDVLREEVTAAMRKVVIERFSYKPTMQRFLTDMGTYLKEEADKKE